MIASKINVLKPLITSQGGFHLTAYIKNDQNVSNLKVQLRDALLSAHEYLLPVMSANELERFLAPIKNMISDTKMLGKLKHNIGIYRNDSSFKVLSLPLEIEEACIVATSFHVKPLLRWMQIDKEFLIIGINQNSASLYLASQSTLNHVDTIIFPSRIKEIIDSDHDIDWNRFETNLHHFEETIEWLDEWLLSLTKSFNPPLFIVGKEDVVDTFSRGFRYFDKRKFPLSISFSKERIIDFYADIKEILKEETHILHEQNLLEFYLAEDELKASRNIFQIATAAISGQVKKLLISDSIKIFGKFNKNTGGVQIHRSHLDHEDDDLLDDLAQAVLINGGEVIIADQYEIPKGRAILALLNKPSVEIEKDPSREYNKEEFERSVV